MRLRIKTRDDKLLGFVEASEGNKVVFDDACQPQFRHCIEALLTKGIRGIRGAYDMKTNTHIKFEVTVKQSDPLFPLAFRDFLKRSGYKIEELHPEVDEEIKKLLAPAPSDNENKRYILEKLPTMSHLDKTFVLEYLKKHF